VISISPFIGIPSVGGNPADRQDFDVVDLGGMNVSCWFF